MNPFLQEVLKATGSKLASVASDGLYTDNIKFTDTGSYMLNALLSGSIYKGLPGKITMFAGPTSVGKTYLLLSVCKYFLDADEKNIVIYYESEGAINSNMLDNRDINKERFTMIPVSTLEDFRTKCLNFLSTYEKYKDEYNVIICLDSLGMLSSSKEVEDTSDGKSTRDMTKAQVLKGIFRVLTLKLSELNVPMIVANHVYSSINSYFPTNVISGGSGAVYPMSQIIELSKRSDKEEKDQIGVILKAKTNKSRLTREGKVVEILLNFSKGLDRHYGLVDLALKYGLFKSVSTRIELPDGSKTFNKTIVKNPEKFFTKDILDQLDKFAQQEFEYGSSLNESVDEDDEPETSLEETSS